MKRILIVISAFAILCNTSCESHKEHKEEETTFPVTSALRMDTTITEEFVCQIHSIQHIELRAQEKGYLQNIYVDEGDFVKKGQLLFQFEQQLVLPPFF